MTVTALAVCEPDRALRLRLGAVAAAAGFDVAFPCNPGEWAATHDGVVLLSVRTLDQLDDVERVRRTRPRGIVVVLLDSPDQAAGRAALRRGASVVLDRHTDPGDVLSTVRLAARGSAVVPAQLLYEFAPAAPEAMVKLDDDELDLLYHLADGATIKRIARQRHQATRTVERHLHRLYNRFGVHDRVQAVATAIQMGLIRMPAPQVPASAGRRSSA
ncbi:LuxR C-terminal-related transcriptional regulator [Nonomuraea angiospora]|uniref:response regulator transcription factor n=1 Tax=Nonomuraea angiospora TaxID=46172 RepID=UPI0033F58E41